LEALLLTDLHFDTIAKRCKLTPSTVEAYEAVFFAVRSMRRATDWLFARAVGYSPFAGFTGPLPATAWKLAALEGGTFFLDWVIASTQGRDLPEGMLKEKGRRREIEEMQFRLFARLWMALRAAVTDEELSRVVKARQQLRKLEAQLGRDVKVSPTEAVMEAYLVALPGKSKKTRGRWGRDKETACRSSPPASGARKTKRPDSPMPLDVQQVVDDIDHAVDAIHKADNAAQTPRTGGPAGEPKQRRRAG
jgi:hypothetical protein